MSSIDITQTLQAVTEAGAQTSIRSLFLGGILARANSTTIPGAVLDQTDISGASAGTCSMQLFGTEFINYQYVAAQFFAGAKMSWPAGVVFNGMANAALTAGFITQSTLADFILGTSLTVILSGAASFQSDVKLANAGNGLYVKEGANATSGIATLALGTVVVNTTKVTANSRIQLTHQNNAGIVGFPSVTARTAGTSFTITSSSLLDTSNVAWIIIEPA